MINLQIFIVHIADSNKLKCYLDFYECYSREDDDDR